MKTTSLPSVLALLTVALAVAGCAPTTTERLGLDDPITIEGLELDRYLGRWYEIGSYPQTFQEGCVGTTATYSLRDDGDIDVLNECIQNGEPIDANGVARAVDLDRGKLEVSFFQPFWGDYWVLELGQNDGADEPYTHAVVGAPSRDSLWILSRTPSLPEAQVDDILTGLVEQSFEPDRIGWTEQPDAA